MKLIFKKIEIRNFLSFGNNTQELDLEFDGTTLILGDNLDTGGANGVGKTAIINAISYALFNKPISNISKERLINKTNNTKNTQMEVRLLFSKGDIEYEIYRSRGENYIINLLADGEDITPDSVSAVDKKILDIIGISYDLFCRVVIFSGNDLPFLDMPLSAQRTIIEELFNITILSEKAIKLRELIKQTEIDIQTADTLIKIQEKNKESHEKRLIDAKNRMEKWDKERIENLNNFKNEIIKLDNIDFVKEENLHLTIINLNQNISKLKNNKITLINELNAKQKRINDVENEIIHLSEARCPYCLQKFENSESKIENLAIEYETLTTKISDQTNELTKIEENLKLLENELIEAKSNLTYKSLQDMTNAKTSAAILKTKIKELEDGINPHIEAYNAILNETIDKIDYEKLDNLKKLLEHQQFLLKLLTDKNSFIRRKIISITIPFLNNRINEYTNVLGFPHIVKFDTDMSCTVSEYGRELDFGNLSSGEKKRVNLALSLAFRDVFHHLHFKINSLFMDEVDGGSLDSQGVDSIIKLIKRKSRDEELGIWVISHRPEMSERFDRELLIKKHNGFSFIVYNED
jgi:DNA repair exonuclease SbcCD ATPase subunit